MICNADNLVSLAIAELGYREKASKKNLDVKDINAGSNNFTKYGRDLDAAGYYTGWGNKNGVAWCSVFVDWLFWKLCGENVKEAKRRQYETSNGSAGVDFVVDYFKKAGKFVTTPKKGDRVFFWSDGHWSHTGIVEYVDDNTVHTIEGNSGNCVRRRSYRLGDGYMRGFGRPIFDAEQKQEEKPVETVKREIYKGAKCFFSGKYHYTSSDAKDGKAVRGSGACTVTAVCSDAKHPFHAVHEDDNCSVFGWVDSADLRLINSSEYKVGDVVAFKGGKHYASSDAVNGLTAKAGPVKITRIVSGAKHPFHVVHTDKTSNAYGWVDFDDLT